MKTNHPKQTIELLAWADTGSTVDEYGADVDPTFSDAPDGIRDTDALAYLAGLRFVTVSRRGTPIDADESDIRVEAIRDMLTGRRALSIKLTGRGRAELARLVLDTRKQAKRPADNENCRAILQAMFELGARGKTSGKPQRHITTKAFHDARRENFGRYFAALKDERLIAGDKAGRAARQWLTSAGLSLARDLANAQTVAKPK